MVYRSNAGKVKVSLPYHNTQVSFVTLLKQSTFTIKFRLYSSNSICIAKQVSIIFSLKLYCKTNFDHVLTTRTILQIKFRLCSDNSNCIGKQILIIL